MAGDGGDRKVVIVRKERGRSHSGHGGSWKVAYADFVTALMAFFLVMWIMAMDSRVKDLIEGYFNNPIGFKKSYSAGTNVLSVGNAPVNMEIKRLAMLARDYQRRRFEEARERIRERLEGAEDLEALQAQVEIVITDDGLRIELVEAADGHTFFALGSAELTPVAERVLRVIAEELGVLANDVMLEGHTDAVRYGRGDYSNWELSVDRANAARRVMVASGLDASRILEVRGYADRELRNPDDPLDPSNRRVTILLPFKEPRRLFFQGAAPAAERMRGMD